MFKPFKPVLAATVGALALTSGLFVASPAEARDGCGRGWRFSHYWGECVPMSRVYATPYFLQDYYWSNSGWYWRGRRHDRSRWGRHGGRHGGHRAGGGRHGGGGGQRGGRGSGGRGGRGGGGRP